MTKIIFKFSSFFILLLVLNSASACTFLGDRARDAADPFRATVSFGFGLDFELHLSRYGMFGGGYTKEDCYGFEGRYAGSWKEKKQGYALLIPAPFAILRDSSRALTSKNSNVLTYALSPSISGYPLRFDQSIRPVELGFNGFFIFFGLGFGIDFVEFGDMFLGWAGLDITSDDTYLNQDLLNLYQRGSGRSSNWSDPVFNAYLNVPEKGYKNITHSNLKTAKILFRNHSSPVIFKPALYVMDQKKNQKLLPAAYWKDLLKKNRLGLDKQNTTKTIGMNFPLRHPFVSANDAKIIKGRIAINKLLITVLVKKTKKAQKIAFDKLLNQLDESGVTALLDLLISGSFNPKLRKLVKNPIDMGGLLVDFYKHLDKNKKFKKQREIFIEYLLTRAFIPSQKLVKQILVLLVDDKEDWELIRTRLVFSIDKKNPRRDYPEETKKPETSPETDDPSLQTGPGLY